MTKHVIWHGVRTPLPEDNKVRLSVDGNLWANLPLYLEEINHSPTGFEWGYRGSGPAQLAYAIMRTYYELALGYSPELSRHKAERSYYQFKDDVVCNQFGKNYEWSIDSDQISKWLLTEAKK